MPKVTIHVFAVSIDCDLDGVIRNGDVIGYAIAKDNGIIAMHLSTDESWTRVDMGVDSNNRHEHYDALFPDGWEIEYHGLTSASEVQKWMCDNNCFADERSGNE